MGPAKKTIEKRKKFKLGYLDDEFSEKAKIYAHTNEKMATLADKMHGVHSVLTVGSSGDQLLNLMVEGIYNIDTFDINQLSNYYINLRLAGIKDIIDTQELWYFLFGLHKKGYEACKHSLDKDTYYFWEHMFELYTIEDLRHILFRGDVDELTLLDNNNYLDMVVLEDLRRFHDVLSRDNFNTHLFNLHSFIKDRKYDAILLSNIYDYVDTKSFLNYLKTLREFLTKDGKIYYSYQYDTKYKYSLLDLLSRKDYKHQLDRDILEELLDTDFKFIRDNTEILELQSRQYNARDISPDSYLVLHK